MTNLIIIGMPGSGKTTIGKPLAKRLGYEFRDSDDDILDHTNCDVSDWLQRLGDERFLSFEAQKIQEYYAGMTNTVLSTGGSVALVPETVDFLKQRGKLVLLDTPISEIVKRAESMRLDRIVEMNGKNPRFKTLEELCDFRRQTYINAANEIISVSNRDNNDIINEIISKL